MILVWLIAVFLVAGLLAAVAGRRNATSPRWIAAAAVAINFTLAVWLWAGSTGALRVLPDGRWLEEADFAWIPQYGIRIHLALDGLSLLMVVLTCFLGGVAVLASWSEIQKRVGFYHLNLLWILAGIVGVFTAVDLFLFYLFWELMLVPMYFLIAVWGHERRVHAAVKFFLFTQLSGLLMLVAMLALHFAHLRATGTATFDYSLLRNTPLDAATARWLFLGFLAAFLVKLPAFPLHTWLPDAHTEAPTAGSVILAGLLLKTGAYGLIRFAVPLFPGAAREWAPALMVLGVAGILYGAILALGQSDLKRMVAYTSVSHMGFVLLGVFAWNELALQGAVIQMVCHGVSTGGLFVLVGALYERTHTRDLRELGGLWATVPVLSGVGLCFAMASLGLPGLGDFVGEFLVLLGTYRVSVAVCVAATIGILGATLYGLGLAQRAFHGPNQHGWQLPDLTVRERVTAGAMIAVLVWIGLAPQLLLDTSRPTLRALQQATDSAAVAQRR